MEKVNPIEFIRRLRSGEDVICPECGEGKVSTQHDPEISHSFFCYKCDFMVNID